jgi:hypothetical protein
VGVELIGVGAEEHAVEVESRISSTNTTPLVADEASNSTRTVSGSPVSR